MRTIVEGNVDAVFAAGIEEAFSFRIFADGVRVTIVGQTSRDLRPGLAVVGCLEKVGVEVIELVAIDGHVGSTRGVRRSFDDADEAPLAEFFGGDIGPVLSAIARYLQEPVVGAGPNQAFLDGRFGESEDDVVILDAGVVLRGRAARGLLLGFFVARQVAPNRSPGHTTVGGLKTGFAAVIDDSWIVGRDHDWRGPLKTVLEVRRA